MLTIPNKTLHCTQWRNKCSLALVSQTELKPNPLCHYIIVRKDLPRGVQSAQIVHASGESVKFCIPSGTYAVVLEAKNEEQLRNISLYLTGHSIDHVSIVENSPKYKGQMTAIGVVPDLRENLRRHLSTLPLLR